MEYTAEKLAEMGVFSVTVIDRDEGRMHYFFLAAQGLDTYLHGGDDASVYCYDLDLDGKQVSDLEVLPVEAFLDIVSSGKELRFNEDRDITQYDIVMK